MEVREGVRLVDDLHDVPVEVSRLRGHGDLVGFDIEATKKEPIDSRLVALQFKPKGKQAVIIDVRLFDPTMLMQLGSMLEPLFDGTITLVGQNLKYDLLSVLFKMNLAGHKVYDTMLAEQVILGMGVSSAIEHNLHLDMASIGARYGIQVSKEERSWFADLDTRIEGQALSQVGSVQEVPIYEMTGGHMPWYEPFPDEQIVYMRQDVSVVHRIMSAQMKRITELHLDEPIALEMRVLFSVVGMEYWGVQIDRDGWLEVIDRVEAKTKELEDVLHRGVDGQYEGLDVYIIKSRAEKYADKWKPYEEWMKARDAFIETRKAEWDAEWEPVRKKLSKDELVVTPQGAFKNWSECKKVLLEWWFERNGKMTRPAPIKSGVNLGSWMQIRDGFNDLFSEPKYWQNGEPIVLTAVGEDDVAKYRNVHPLVGVYIEYIHHHKILTVYGRERGRKEHSFIELLDANNRLRAKYQQIGADTQRMSSYYPNIQQIPDTGVGKKLREKIIAAPGYVLVDADFSNIELRIVAELSGDKYLLNAFATGEDVHSSMAVIMFALEKNSEFVAAMARGEDRKTWTDTHNAVVGGTELKGTSYRKATKTINYSLLYGAGVQRLAVSLGVAENYAGALRDIYYETFQQAINWLKEQKAKVDQARKKGQSKVYAETRAGWKRWFTIPNPPKSPVVRDKENGVSRLTVEATEQYNKAQDEWRAQLGSIKRQMANTPVQGLSAAITKEADAQLYEAIGYNPFMRMVGTFHDEFLLEVKKELVNEAKTILKTCMYNAMNKYLWVVDKGKIEPVESSYWKH